MIIVFNSVGSKKRAPLPMESSESSMSETDEELEEVRAKPTKKKNRKTLACFGRRGNLLLEGGDIKLRELS